MSLGREAGACASAALEQHAYKNEGAEEIAAVIALRATVDDDPFIRSGVDVACAAA